MNSSSKLPAEKLPELPDNWEWVHMLDIGSPEKNAIVDGPFGSNLKVSDYIENGPVPVLTTKNLTGDYENVRYISEDKFQELKRSEVKPKDILMAKIGSCGKTGIYPNNMPSAIIPANLMKITVHPEIEQKYVYYYFDSIQFQQHLKTITKATAQPAFGVTNFKKLPFPLAPREQQKRIVAKIEELFSHIDAGIEGLQKAKQLLKQYRQSVLKAAVTGELTKEWREANKDKLEPASKLLERILKERREKWEEQQLEQFKAKGKMPKNDKWKENYKEPEELQLDIEVEKLPAEWVIASLEMFGELYCGQSPSVSQVNTEGNGVLYVTGPEQWNGKSIEEKKWTEHPKRQVPDGCIFITVKGAGVGKLFPGVACAIGRDVYAFKPHEELDARYIINVVRHGINKVIAKAQGDIPGLSRIHIMGHIVGLPSIEEQILICDSLEEKIVGINRLELQIHNQLMKAEKSKQSVLSSAFSGRME